MRKYTVILLIMISVVTVDLFVQAAEREPIAIPDIDLTEKPEHGQTNFTSIILEVKGDPLTQKTYIEKNYPELDVVQTYTLLFNGLALKGEKSVLQKIGSLDFVKKTYPVYTYKAIELNNDLAFWKKDTAIEKEMEDIERAGYTGKGVKVAVIDTGIDYTHPDLKKNFKGGYDLVDLDDDPMETLVEEGMPTLHGSHVAGIIAANGALKGVAPDAEIYAYRALGPGGMGSSIQVIAAMEQAVRDGVDIINLSLGNAVNGPDYPTSTAVDEASKHGVAVVVANGNDGPADWTIGSPATATAAFSVGAYEAAREQAYLYEPKTKRTIDLITLPNAAVWNMSRDYPITSDEPAKKIKVIHAGAEPVAGDVLRAEKQGAMAVLIYTTEEDQAWQVGLQEEVFDIPVAIIEAKDGKWFARNEGVYVARQMKKRNEKVTDFSSRGPVTVDWEIKPDIIAPGADVLSTVPGGYERLSGTSMASPYVAGVIALMKEAKADWTNEQIFGALKTTAKTLHTDEDFREPILQGNGLVNVLDALQTNTIILNTTLSFGKIDSWLQKSELILEIENISNSKQVYYFDMPVKEKGMTWDLPQQFSLEANEKKKLEIGLKVNTHVLDEGMHQGWIKLLSQDAVFDLPYLFINKEAAYPKIMGFDFRLHPSEKDEYHYQMYLPDEVKSVEVDLYDAATLMADGSLYRWNNLQVGMNEGRIPRRKIKQKGNYIGVIKIQLENGKTEKYETEIYLE